MGHHDGSVAANTLQPGTLFNEVVSWKGYGVLQTHPERGRDAGYEPELPWTLGITTTEYMIVGKDELLSMHRLWQMPGLHARRQRRQS